jgi:hypothetical protein
MTFFCIATPEQYELVRLQLDAALGYPNADTMTSVEPADSAPRDAHGRVLLAIGGAMESLPQVAAVFWQLAATGGCETISAAQYENAITRPAVE